MRPAGRALVEALERHGVDTVFGVPGESYLAVLDALYAARERIRLVTCRHEGAAAHMAEAYGKLTGRPGICFVTRGPGATHASIGVHTARQDSTPLVLFVGQVPRAHLGREAFQELDHVRMFEPLAKWAAQIDDPSEIPEAVGRAFHAARSERPGPVVLALPEDVLREECAAQDVEPRSVAATQPSDLQLAQLQALLARARRPVVIVGGSGWSAPACADLQVFLERNDLPAAVSFRRQDCVDNGHRCYVGDLGIGIQPSLAERIGRADLLLALGTRLGEITTAGYTLLEAPRPRQTLVHVHADAGELGRVYQAQLAIHASVAPFAAAVRQLGPLDAAAWAKWRAAARDDYLASLACPAQPGALDMGEVMRFLRERLPADSIVTNGAGNFSAWPNKFYTYRGYRTQLAPTSGAMGYGVPAAIAAKLVHPERTVVCFAGDGDFLMSAQELATAMQYALDPIFLVVNNGMYGTIRLHQERQYPGRVHGTDLVNPDFAGYARAFGAHGECVERTEDFAPAFERALASRCAALIELRVDAEGITPRTTLGELRRAAVVAGQGEASQART